MGMFHGFSRLLNRGLEAEDVPVGVVGSLGGASGVTKLQLLCCEVCSEGGELGGVVGVVGVVSGVTIRHLDSGFELSDGLLDGVGLVG